MQLDPTELAAARAALTMAEAAYHFRRARELAKAS